MSRSYKKNAISGIACCYSNKKFKRTENRRLRTNVNQLLNSNFDPDDIQDSIPDDKMFGNEWDSPREGKSIAYTESEFNEQLIRFSYLKDSSWWTSYKNFIRRYKQK